MKTYHGSCDCGTVKFEVTTKITKISKCNCHICTKIRNNSSPSRTKSIQSNIWKRWFIFASILYNDCETFFCKHCGIHSFYNPRTHPEKISVNVRCLDDFDLKKEAPIIVTFDGRNWEESFKSL